MSAWSFPADPSFPPPEIGKDLAGQEAGLSQIDSINYLKPPVSDAQGRISFPALIPGATYRMSDFSARPSQLRKEFTVKPGETIDLGDILIEKPAAE